MLKNVAFIGKAGAGKTVAALFAAELGYHKMSFATPLKRISAELWGDEFDRVRLQKFGVAVRDIYEDTWCDLLIKDVRAANRYSADDDPRPVVVDDCRFPNEYHALRGEGFEFFRIVADEVTRVNRLQANGKWGGHDSLNHISETALDNFACRRIENDGDVIEFYERVGKALESVNR